MAEAAAMTGRPAAIVEMNQAGEIVLSFDLGDQAASVLALLEKYADRGIDLTDACIVRMTELTRDCRVVTVDRADFSVSAERSRSGSDHRAADAAIVRRFLAVSAYSRLYFFGRDSGGTSLFNR
jgi:hypothetical protein